MNRKLIALTLLIALLSALILSACAAGGSSETMNYTTDSDAASRDYYSNGAGGMPSVSEEMMAPAEAPVTSNASVERIVIKNASLQISVDDPEASMARISQMAEEMGGYIVSANMYQTYRADGAEVPAASLTIRVPAEKLAEAMNRIKAETTQPVRSENISSQDVTAEYTDLQSRLRNLEAAESQLQEIMDKAVKTEDVLNVYSQLVSIREQIEVIKGQIKYYEQSAALSSINIDLTATAAGQPIQVGGWQPEGTVRDAIQSLIYAFQALVDFLIWLVLFALPMLIVIIIPVWVVILLIRRWRRSRRKPTPSA